MCTYYPEVIKSVHPRYGTVIKADDVRGQREKEVSGRLRARRLSVPTVASCFIAGSYKLLCLDPSHLKTPPSLQTPDPLAPC